MVSMLMRARKGLMRLGLAAAAAAGLAACEPLATGGPRIDTSRAVPVALLVPAGSGAASDDFLARSLENAARLAVADLGGNRIDLRIYPTAGQPAQAAAAATRAVNEGARIILGPVFAQEANAVGLAVAPRGINVLSFSNNADIAGGNVFVLGPTFSNTADRLAQFAVRQGKTRFLAVHDRTPAGEIGLAAIRDGVTGAGGQLVSVAGYEFSQNGIVNAVPSIAAAARSGTVDALFLTADSAGALPLVTQLLRDNGVDPAVQQFIGLTRWDIPAATVELPGVQGGWFALPDPALYGQFQSRYSAAYGETPPPIAGLAYDGIAAIGALVRQGRGDALTAAALTQGAGFVGTGGIFRLRGDGTNERGLAVAQIRDRQVVVIDPAPRSFGGFGS
ncbi:MAG: penicillin-binding protein activator [Rhodobacterales bacterium]|nr:penicillin-binding protein activator [Rhodobacterales bacterium]